MILQKLQDRGLINPPQFVGTNTHYLTIMGSMAYGTSNDSSDMDIYGFCIPPKSVVFPHTVGVIKGFGDQGEEFNQWQIHHIKDEDALGGKGKEYDFSVFSIVKYFQLCMENNPNCLDSLFTNQTCVLQITAVGTMVRDNRHLFLSKQCYPKFKGYAYSQLHKMTGHIREGKRKEIYEKFGFDVKYAMHLVRLLNECEQILMKGDMDLQQNNEHLKAIRRGEVKEEDIRKWASDKEKQLEDLYVKSSIPTFPDADAIKQLLINCLEHHYGNLDKCIHILNKHENAINEIKKVLEKFNV